MRTRTGLILVLGLIAVTFLTAPLFAAGQKESKPAKEVEIVMVHKLLGIPWIVRETEGVKAAGKDLGIKADLVAPAIAGDVSQQVKILQDLVARGVDGIVIVPGDAEAVAPVLSQATAKGIVTIATESPGQKGAMYDVEALDNEQYGRMMMDNLAKHTGGKAHWIGFVGELTTLSLNLWLDAAERQAKEKYPEMKELTTRIPSHDDLENSYKITLDLIKTYPDLTGILGTASPDAPGAAKAIEEKGLQDKIAVGGTSIPSMAGKYIQSGAQKWGQAWDPFDMGYATVYIANLLRQGKKLTAGMEIPHLGKITIKGTDVNGNVPIFFTKDNLDQYKF
jgi:simple sugar transport system substrate-binding protein